MNKLSLVLYANGEAKVGKSHLSMLGFSGTGEDTLMIDMTPAKHAQFAAMRVYGGKFKDRYFPIEEDAKELLKVIEEHEDVPTICIDESKNLRDAFAKPVLEVINQERSLAKPKKSPIKTIYPVTRWSDVYKDVDDMFRKYEGVHNFIITAGLKDRRGFDKETKTSYITGKRESEGLKTLKTVCDIGINVSVEVGMEKRKRIITVLINRLLDAGGKEWVAEVTGLKDLMDRIVDDGRYKREWFLV